MVEIGVGNITPLTMIEDHCINITFYYKINTKTIHQCSTYQSIIKKKSS